MSIPLPPATLVAAHARREHSEGAAVWFCHLADARDLAGACSVVARALGVLTPPDDDGDAAASLARALAARGPGLLVLDNFEQLVGHAAGAVAQWLEAAPDLKVIATSREAMRLPQEAVLEPGSGIEVVDDAATAG